MIFFSQDSIFSRLDFLSKCSLPPRLVSTRILRPVFSLSLNVTCSEIMKSIVLILLLVLLCWTNFAMAGWFSSVIGKEGKRTEFCNEFYFLTSDTIEEGAESGSTETVERTESDVFEAQESHSSTESTEESKTTTTSTSSTTDSRDSEPVIETTTVDSNSNSCPWFLCNNTRCVLDTWRCDMQDDCGDNSDEEGCENSSCDAMEQFRCSSGMCISKDWLCDWIKDCPHGDDEDNC